MKSKKAAGKMLSLYWFLILLIVAFGIWAMAYAYYSHPSDVRDIEARTLSNKVADCISQKGSLVGELFESGNLKPFTSDAFESFCHFNFKAEDVSEHKDQYYIEISFFDANKIPKFSNIIYGESKIKDFCEKGVEEGQEFERLPKCLTRRFYSLDNNDQQTLVEIYVGVSKVEKNVKL